MNDINALINQHFDPATERTVNTFSSGAVSITIRDRGHVAVIDGTPLGQWGLSIDPDDANAMTGHDTVTDSLTTVLDLARTALR